jgi:hypothetical protein
MKHHGEYEDAVWIAKSNKELEAELQEQFKSDLKSIVFIASCILAFFLVVWSTLPDA